MSRSSIAVLLVATVLGCSSTRITDLESYQGRRLPRPDRILVYDFAATGADLPAFSRARDRYAAPQHPHTAEEIATGRELGSIVAERLVAEIAAMGLTATRANARSQPRIGDITLVGYFETIDEGSTTKRVVIGSGSAELKTHVEGYRMTDSGMHQLASGEVESGSDKTPGFVMPLIVTIAAINPPGIATGGAVTAGDGAERMALKGTAERTAHAIAEELRKAFERQGWI
jgi:hypothetical protein